MEREGPQEHNPTPVLPGRDGQDPTLDKGGRGGVAVVGMVVVDVKGGTKALSCCSVQ